MKMQSLVFSHADFDKLVEKTVSELKRLSEQKGGEYAGDFDRLANFRRNAAALHLNMEQIWAVYAAKHWDAIMQYILDISTGKERTRAEPLDGRADDLIVYLILFKAMLVERRDVSWAEAANEANK